MALERDPISGRETTGHEWDGITELNTPVPTLVKWFYGLTIAFTLLYWVLYPALPGIGDFTRGVLEYSTRADTIARVDRAAAERSDFERMLLAGDPEDLVVDQNLRDLISESTAILYRDNCAACHGTTLKGQVGFPNLTDDHWLWSGSVAEIESVIRYGINSGHDEERIAEMLAFGQQQMLDRSQIKDVVQYVLALTGQDHATDPAKRGEGIFLENCASCHGESGEGGLEVGAPSLIDDQWIYGSGENAIFRTVWDGRKGVMPAWEGRLSDADIRKLALFVKWKSDGRTD